MQYLFVCMFQGLFSRFTSKKECYWPVASQWMPLALIAFPMALWGQSSSVSPSAERGANLVEIGKIKAKSSSQIQGSYWGIQAGSLNDSILSKAHNLGVKWTRLHANWEEIEKEKGKYHWKKTDEAFSAVAKYGITPFVTITRGNRLYTGTSTYDDPKLAALYGINPKPPIGSEAEMKAWLSFVGKVITRYKDQIKHWEIWNEPNHRKYWGAKPNGEDYGRLVRATAEKIRSIQPGATIIAGSMAGISAKFADAFLSHCDPQKIDIISFHHYANLPEERIYSMEKFLQVLEKHNPKLGIWQGECGYPSQSRTTGYRGRAPWGLNIQAKWLLRQSLVDTYYCRATLSNYFLLAHFGSLEPDLNRGNLNPLDTLLGYPERKGSRVHALGVNQKCILFRENYQPKPAFYAYQNLCAAMDDRYKPFPAAYHTEVLDPGIFYGIGQYEDAFPSVPLVTPFQSDQQESLIAYWLPWNPQEYLPRLANISLEIDQVSFKDPVLVDLIQGTVYQIKGFESRKGGSFFAELPLGDYPMILIERDALSLEPR